jgi:hypothetical protein
VQQLFEVVNRLLATEAGLSLHTYPVRRSTGRTDTDTGVHIHMHMRAEGDSGCQRERT